MQLNDTPLPATKTCAMCGETKPISMYGVKAGVGVKARCRTCLAKQQQQYLAVNRETYNAAHRADRAAKRVVRDEARRQYQEDHAEEIRLADAERSERRRQHANEIQRAYYAAHAAKIQEYNRRSKARHADKVTERERRWKTANRDRVRQSNARWLAANEERMRLAIKARTKVKDAIRSGQLVRSTACEECGAVNVPIEGAHFDYGRPLDVRWLCRRCHRRWDARSPKTIHQAARPGTRACKISSSDIPIDSAS